MGGGGNATRSVVVTYSFLDVSNDRVAQAEGL